MQHKRILFLLIAFLFFGRLSHLQATQSNLSSKEKKVVLPTLALMFLNNTLSNLANTTENSDTTKDKLQLKHFPFSKRFCLDGAFQPLHTLPSSLDENNRLAKDILTPRPGDKVRLITGKMAQIKTVAPPKEKAGYFSYTVALNDSITKRVYDEHLVGLQSKLARCERQLALGDVVLVKDDAKIVLLDGSEDALKPLGTNEITFNPGAVHKANPIGKVVYLDGAWVGLMQTNLSLSLPLKTKTNKKHTNEKVNHKSLNQQQLSTKPLSRPTRWLVPTSHIQCILDREKRYKVYTREKKDRVVETYKKDLSLRYPLAARSPMGSLIYQTSSNKFTRRMAHFTDSFTHKVLLQGNKTQVLDIEKELLLPAYADESLPSRPSALASGSLSLYNKSNTNKTWESYTYTLQPTTANYTAKLSLSIAHHKDEKPHNLLLPKNTATQVFFWCHKRYMPCRYGLVVTQANQPLVFSFVKERERRIFYHALVWLTSPYVLAIEEVNNQPTRQTRLLACADINTMTLQQLATHMKTQWLVREGTLHQEVNLFNPHFTFKKHQQQSLSQYYDWSSGQRYKKVDISLYRTSRPDCIARFGRYPLLNHYNQEATICPVINNIMDILGGLDTLLMNGLHPEACQGLCTYVDYLFEQNNDYTFEQAKHHMATYYHGRPIPCPNQSKCPYHTLTTHQAQCHRLLYSHAPRRTRAPQNLSHGTSPFKSQEDPIKARLSQYQPSQLEIQAWDSMHGYLQPFIHEQITNGYLYVWAGYDKQKIDFDVFEPYYKKLLAYKKDDPSALNVSLACLPMLKAIKNLFFKKRHQHMGYPLTLAELAAIYAYTAWDGLCSDFNNSLRKNDYHRWQWLDGLLHKAITQLSFLEDAHYPLYTGFKNIHLHKTRQHDQRWQDYTSSTPYPAIATTFHDSKGMKITINPSMRKSNHVPCCDVSWISPYPEEGEVLFARGTAGHSQNTTQGADGWEVKVTGKEYQLQQISVWHKAIFQLAANHPLPMNYQLFGHTQAFNFVPATYHHLIDNLLSGQGIDVHQKLGVQKDQSLLWIASQYGHTEVIMLLLNHDDINVNPKNFACISAFYIAVSNGHTEVVILLLDHDDIDVNLQDERGGSPLFMAAQNGHTDIVKLLLKHNDIDVNLQAYDGSFPLFVAATNGHTDIVKLLLKDPKIKVNLQTDDETSALYMAAQQGHTDVVKLLLKDLKIKVNLQNDKGGSPLLMAAQQGHTNVVQLLLDHDDINVNLQTGSGASPLLMAATNGHIDIVRLLLAQPGIQVNLAIKNPKLTPRDAVYAKMKNTQDPAVWDKYYTMRQLLIEKGGKLLACANLWPQPPLRPLSQQGSNLDMQINDNTSLLLIAAAQGQTDVVAHLLKHPKINVNFQSKEGYSALFMAAKNGHTDIVKLLLKHPKIKVNLQDEDGTSPLFFAAQNGHTDIVKLLLKDPKIKVNLQHNSGASPLLMAAQNGHTDVVKLLLKHPKIKVNLQNNKGVSPLLMAAHKGYTDIVILLLEHDDIDVNLQRDTGVSPLWISAGNGHTDIVKLLLAQPGIQVNLATKINPKLTPRDAVYFQMKNTQDPAVWDKYYTIRQLLIEKGGTLLYFANAYPQPPLRPSNQQGVNVDMQNFLLSLFSNRG